MLPIEVPPLAHFRVHTVNSRRPSLASPLGIISNCQETFVSLKMKHHVVFQ